MSNERYPVRILNACLVWLKLSATSRTCAAIWLLTSITQAVAQEEFIAMEYEVLRAGSEIEIDGKLDEPVWFAAPQFSPFHFTWYEQGKKEGTVVKMLWDDEHLYIAHICQDAYITARTREHDGPVAKDDCFELMIAPDTARPNFYFNVEWNVIGGYVDGHRPQGPKGPRADWDVEGVQIAGSYVGTLNDDTDIDQYWTVEVAIPLKNFSVYSPKSQVESGTVWNLNINRHGGDTNMQYSQWSPGDTPQPAFHTPHRFGRLIFSDSKSPF